MDKDTELYCHTCKMFFDGMKRASVHASRVHALDLKNAMDRGVIGKVV